MAAQPSRHSHKEQVLKTVPRVAGEHTARKQVPGHRSGLEDM